MPGMPSIPEMPNGDMPALPGMPNGAIPMNCQQLMEYMKLLNCMENTDHMDDMPMRMEGEQGEQ